MKLSSLAGRALLAYAVLSQLVECTAPRCNGAGRTDRADATLASDGAMATSCASGWMPVDKALCIRFAGLQQGDESPADVVAMTLVSKTDYAHLGLRVAVFRGAERWCAFPTVLSLAQIEANHEYDFRVPCSMSGKLVDSGEFRLVVEVDEAIEKHSKP